MSPGKIRIRPEEAEDVLKVRSLHEAAFPTGLEARLVDALRDADRLSVSLVAVANEGGGDSLVGHIAFSPVTTVATGETGAGLGPIAVLATHRRRGVAAQLVNAGVMKCRQSGFGWIVVLGDQAYYRRFGFRAASDFGLVDQFNGGVAFQAMEIVTGRLPMNAGVIQYAPEFAALGAAKEPPPT